MLAGACQPASHGWVECGQTFATSTRRLVGEEVHGLVDGVRDEDPGGRAGVNPGSLEDFECVSCEGVILSPLWSGSRKPVGVKVRGAGAFLEP